MRLVQHLPSVSFVAPLDGGVMIEVVVGHQDVGVVPAVIGVGGTRFLGGVVGDAPWQKRLVEADHQSAGAARDSSKHNAL